MTNSTKPYDNIILTRALAQDDIVEGDDSAFQAEVVNADFVDANDARRVCEDNVPARRYYNTTKSIYLNSVQFSSVPSWTNKKVTLYKSSTSTGDSTKLAVDPDLIGQAWMNSKNPDGSFDDEFADRIKILTGQFTTAKDELFGTNGALTAIKRPAAEIDMQALKIACAKNDLRTVVALVYNDKKIDAALDQKIEVFDVICLYLGKTMEIATNDKTVWTNAEHGQSLKSLVGTEAEKVLKGFDTTFSFKFDAKKDDAANLTDLDSALAASAPQVIRVFNTASAAPAAATPQTTSTSAAATTAPTTAVKSADPFGIVHPAFTAAVSKTMTDQKAGLADVVATLNNDLASVLSTEVQAGLKKVDDDFRAKNPNTKKFSLAGEPRNFATTSKLKGLELAFGLFGHALLTDNNGKRVKLDYPDEFWDWAKKRTPSVAGADSIGVKDPERVKFGNKANPISNDIYTLHAFLHFLIETSGVGQAAAAAAVPVVAATPAQPAADDSAVNPDLAAPVETPAETPAPVAVVAAEPTPVEAAPVPVAIEAAPTGSPEPTPLDAPTAGDVPADRDADALVTGPAEEVLAAGQPEDDDVPAGAEEAPYPGLGGADAAGDVRTTPEYNGYYVVSNNVLQDIQPINETTGQPVTAVKTGEAPGSVVDQDGNAIKINGVDYTDVIPLAQYLSSIDKPETVREVTITDFAPYFESVNSLLSGRKGAGYPVKDDAGNELPVFEEGATTGSLKNNVTVAGTEYSEIKPLLDYVKSLPPITVLQTVEKTVESTRVIVLQKFAAIDSAPTIAGQGEKLIGFNLNATSYKNTADQTELEGYVQKIIEQEAQGYTNFQVSLTGWADGDARQPVLNAQGNKVAGRYLDIDGNVVTNSSKAAWLTDARAKFIESEFLRIYRVKSGGKEFPRDHIHTDGLDSKKAEANGKGTLLGGSYKRGVEVTWTCSKPNTAQTTAAKALLEGPFAKYLQAHANHDADAEAKADAVITGLNALDAKYAPVVASVMSEILTVDANYGERDLLVTRLKTFISNVPPTVSAPQNPADVVKAIRAIANVTDTITLPKAASTVQAVSDADNGTTTWGTASANYSLGSNSKLTASVNGTSFTFKMKSGAAANKQLWFKVTYTDGTTSMIKYTFN